MEEPQELVCAPVILVISCHCTPFQKILALCRSQTLCHHLSLTAQRTTCAFPIPSGIKATSQIDSHLRSKGCSSNEIVILCQKVTLSKCHCRLLCLSCCFDSGCTQSAAKRLAFLTCLFCQANVNQSQDKVLSSFPALLVAMKGITGQNRPSATQVSSCHIRIYAQVCLTRLNPALPALFTVEGSTYYGWWCLCRDNVQEHMLTANFNLWNWWRKEAALLGKEMPFQHSHFSA